MSDAEPSPLPTPPSQPFPVPIAGRPSAALPPMVAPLALNYASPQIVQWVRLATYPTATEANLARLTLQSAGIQTQAFSRGHASVYGLSSDTEIKVPAEDEAASRALLDEVNIRREARREKHFSTCPVCGAFGSIPIAAARWTANRRMILVLLIGAAILASLIRELVFSAALLILAGIVMIDLTWRLIFPPLDRCQGIRCGHIWTPALLDDDDLADDDQHDENADKEDAENAGDKIVPALSVDDDDREPGDRP